MSDNRQAAKVGLTGRFSSWLTSFSGIVSSIAAVATAAASLFAAYQRRRR